MHHSPMPQFMTPPPPTPAAPPKKPRGRAQPLLYWIPIALALSFWFLRGVAPPGYTWRDVMDRLNLSPAEQPRYSRLAVLGVVLITATVVARIWRGSLCNPPKEGGQLSNPHGSRSEESQPGQGGWEQTE